MTTCSTQQTHKRGLAARAFGLIAAALMIAPSMAPADEAHHSADKAEPASKRVGDIYPLASCPVSGMELGSMGDPYVYMHEGREIRFCCEGCVDKFEADPAKYLAKADAAIIEQQKDRYPLATCITSGEDLPADESKIDRKVIGNRYFAFCCPGCDKDVAANPEKFFAKLNEAAIEAQKADYALATCPVSGEELGSMGAPIDYVFNGKLVRFCCEGCVSEFEKNPHTFMAKVKKAAGAKHAGEHSAMMGEHRGMHGAMHGKESKDEASAPGAKQDHSAHH